MKMGKWRNCDLSLQKELLKDLDALYCGEIGPDPDFSIITGDNVVHMAHRFVLAFRSDFFATMFKMYFRNRRHLRSSTQQVDATTGMTQCGHRHPTECWKMAAIAPEDDDDMNALSRNVSPSPQDSLPRIWLECTRSEMFIDDVTGEQFRPLLRYMYTGAFEMIANDFGHMLNMLILADRFMLPRLVRMLTREIFRNRASLRRNALRLFLTASAHAHFCQTKICAHAQRFILDRGYHFLRDIAHSTSDRTPIDTIAASAAAAAADGDDDKCDHSNIFGLNLPRRFHDCDASVLEYFLSSDDLVADEDTIAAALIRYFARNRDRLSEADVCRLLGTIRFAMIRNEVSLAGKLILSDVAIASQFVERYQQAKENTRSPQFDSNALRYRRCYDAARLTYSIEIVPNNDNNNNRKGNNSFRNWNNQNIYLNSVLSELAQQQREQLLQQRSRLYHNYKRADERGGKASPENSSSAIEISLTPKESPVVLLYRFSSRFAFDQLALFLNTKLDTNIVTITVDVPEDDDDDKGDKDIRDKSHNEYDIQFDDEEEEEEEEDEDEEDDKENKKKEEEEEEEEENEKNRNEKYENFEKRKNVSPLPPFDYPDCRWRTIVHTNGVWPRDDRWTKIALPDVCFTRFVRLTVTPTEQIAKYFHVQGIVATRFSLQMPLTKRHTDAKRKRPHMERQNSIAYSESSSSSSFVLSRDGDIANMQTNRIEDGQNYIENESDDEIIFDDDDDDDDDDFGLKFTANRRREERRRQQQQKFAAMQRFTVAMPAIGSN